MKVVKAKFAGACYGVQRALNIAKDTLDKKGSAYTLGPLIHNPQVVIDMEKRGAKATEDISEIGGSSVIIRSHGVVPEVYNMLSAQGATVVDATCPHVSRAQRAAEELGSAGCHVLVVGEAGHPEVMGLCAYARKSGANVDVVQNANDLPEEIQNPVGVVVQTTQTKEALNDVIDKLHKLNFDPIVKNTICSATTQRQKTAAEIAAQVDAMVVIGGRNSSNTTRLYEICQSFCSYVYHVESAKELTPAMFVGCSVVGVTAGASTPEEQISAAIDVLEGYPEKIVGAKIKDIMPDSVAYVAGFEPGCVISSINNHQLTDYLVWKWYSADTEIKLDYIDLDGEEGTIVLYRNLNQDWGFDFDGVIYDEVKTCKNACTFCFMKQLPDGLRKTLYIRDDDFRLSFLTGTFATLTNLTSVDEARIINERISPLRVSLHALDPKVRKLLMGNNAQVGFDALERLLEAGIEFNLQIVLVPGLNTGQILIDTLNWAFNYSGILNIGIVPLGFTKYQTVFSNSFDDMQDSQDILDLIAPFQKRAQKERGSAWVFAADEFYKNAFGTDLLKKLPSADFYAECDMYEDGIGIIRNCVDEFYDVCEKGIVAQVDDCLKQSDLEVIYISGEAMQPYFDQLIEGSKVSQFKSLTVENDFFGGNVNVTGLLCGQDICNAIINNVKDNRETASKIYLIPDVVFNSDNLTLDDFTIEDIRRQTESQVFIVSSNPLDYFQEIIGLLLEKGAM